MHNIMRKREPRTHTHIHKDRGGGGGESQVIGPSNEIKKRLFFRNISMSHTR